VGVPLKMEHRDPRPGEAARNFTEPTRARSGLRWDAKVSLPDGLAATVRWMQTWRG
jgi:nucleoside-diphosphate-sugar epimerase